MSKNHVCMESLITSWCFVSNGKQAILLKTLVGKKSFTHMHADFDKFEGRSVTMLYLSCNQIFFDASL